MGKKKPTKPHVIGRSAKNGRFMSVVDASFVQNMYWLNKK